MAQRAQVKSLEALETFRSRLILYMGQARSALEEVSAEVMRTRSWLENEQRMAVENRCRKLARVLEDAQQALFSARLSTLKTESSAEQLAVHRAKRAFDEGQAQLQRLKHWAKDYDNRVQPLLKQVEKLHTVLTTDLPHAAAYLAEVIQVLAAYAELKAPPVNTGVEPGGDATGGAKP